MADIYKYVMSIKMGRQKKVVNFMDKLTFLPVSVETWSGFANSPNRK